MSDTGDREPDDDVDDEELAELAGELSTVLGELRDELRASREGRTPEPVEETGAGGGPQLELDIDLPSATDVLAFTDERLIPAAITVLEVNIRALELLQKGIRWARPDRAGENAQRVRSHAESVSRSTLQRLDTVLADLQEAAGEGALPENAEASGIITEARRLRDEIDGALQERVEDREDEAAGSLPGDPDADAADGVEEDEGPPSPWGDQPEVDVDVEGELESIKAELGKDDESDGDGEDPPEATDGTDAKETDTAGEADATGETDGDGDASGNEAGEGSRDAEEDATTDFEGNGGGVDADPDTGVDRDGSDDGTDDDGDDGRDVQENGDGDAPEDA